MRTKRAYGPAEPADGPRFLVDALWPRGIRKDSLRLTGWLKEVAPSKELRQWFSHEPARWDEFKRRYLAELAERQALLQPLLDAARKGNITLVFGARDTERNNAVVLKEFIDDRL